MTLDIVKFITNAVKTQAKIHHLDISTKTVEKVPESVSKLIFDQYGDKYLLDADYVSFFWGNIEKDDIEKLFNVVDKALGKSANRLTESDFKILKVDFKSSSSSSVISADDETSKEEDKDEEESTDEEVRSTDDSDSSEDNEKSAKDEKESTNNDEDDDEEEEIELNEDDDNDNEISIDPNYYFLKITIK